MSEAHQIVKRPLITEKSTRQKEEGNQIAFVVDPERTRSRFARRWKNYSK